MSNLLLMNKRILLDASPILYNRPFSAAALGEDWEWFNSEWRCQGDLLIGRNENPTAGALLLKQGFPGDVLLQFRARNVLPSAHDIDAMWNCTWDEPKGSRTAYVLGIQGWYEGKIGFEKAPENRLAAMAPCPWFAPGREILVQVGSIAGHCFVFVDGLLRIEMLDPDPIDSARHNRVGVEAFQSMYAIRDFTLRRIVWEERPQKYAAEF